MKKKLILIMSVILSLVVIIGILYYKNFIVTKHYKNNDIKIEYDNFWNIEEKDNVIKLSNEDAIINIYNKKLDNYQTIATIKNIVKADYQEYKLFYEDTNTFNSNYLGANLILEDENNQMLSVVLQRAEHVVILEYSNIKEEFDITLDNVIKIVSKIEILGD